MKSFSTVFVYSFALLTTSFALHAENNLEGPYVGIDLGYLDGTENGNEKLSGADSGYHFEAKPKGFGLGLALGYDAILSDKFLIGAEIAGYRFKNTDDRTTPYDDNTSGYTTNTYKMDLKYKLETKLKAGVVFNEKKSSIYILGGVGAAKIERTYTTISEGDYNNNDWTYGTLFGFGSEHIVSENISIKIEHIISNYGEEKINTNASWVNTKQYMDLNDSTTHVGLQYRF
jgi:opacity protein-like surface antigen